MPWWWFLPVVAAFLLATGLVPLVRRLAVSQGAIDYPNDGRKKHAAPTPLWGGLAIFFAVAVPVLVVLFATDHLTSGQIDRRQIIGFLIAGAVLVAGGMIDDKKNLPAAVSFAFPLAAAVIAVGSGIGVAKLTNPLGGYFLLPGWVSVTFAFVWLLGTTYTTKLLDGLDGLATGIATTAALMITMLALSAKFFQPDVALLACTVGAAGIGFLAWNRPPAKIFLGEGGSTLLGFLVGVLAIISGGKVATALLVLGIPALDVAFVIVRRLARRQNPFTVADREHLHHLLLDRGVPPRRIVALYVMVALLFGLTTLVFASWQKIVVLAILGLLSLIAVLKLGKKSL